MLLLLALAYPLAVAGLALLLRRVLPDWGAARLVPAAAVPGPAVVLALAAVAVARLGPAQPGGTDANGMAMMVYLLGGAMLAAFMLALGLPAAWAALRLTRRRAPGTASTPVSPPPAPPPAPEADPSSAPPASLQAPSPPGASDPGFDALLAPLPGFAQEELRRRNRIARHPPVTPAELFAHVHGWLVSAGIAEGRGGYPGGRGAPGWTEYAEEQRLGAAVFRAAEAAWGPAPAPLSASVAEYERRFPPPVRRMGDGWEPHVDEVAGRLIYGFPVESGFATASFAFPVTERDLAVLLADPYRRAVLEVVTHTAYQRSMIRDARQVTERDARALVDAVLHAPDAELAVWLAAFDREHNIGVDHYARQAMARRAGG